MNQQEKIKKCAFPGCETSMNILAPDFCKEHSPKDEVKEKDMSWPIMTQLFLHDVSMAMAILEKDIKPVIKERQEDGARIPKIEFNHLNLEGDKKTHISSLKELSKKIMTQSGWSEEDIANHPFPDEWTDMPIGPKAPRVALERVEKYFQIALQAFLVYEEMVQGVSIRCTPAPWLGEQKPEEVVEQEPTDPQPQPKPEEK